jgi:hypothetical protein
MHIFCLATSITFLLVSQSIAQRVVTFELLNAPQFIPSNTDIHADGFPVTSHFFLDEYDLPGSPAAIISQVGGAQGKVLNLSGGARFSFKPTNIAITSADFDFAPFANPNAAAGNYLVLNDTLFDLSGVLGSPSGVLTSGSSHWNYLLWTLGDGYQHLRITGFGNSQPRQFAIVGGPSVTVDNVSITVFPEPSSLAVSLAPMAMLAMWKRKTRRVPIDAPH